MIKIENTEVFGWDAAIRGMRNPMNSWHLSDSGYCEGRSVRCDTCCDRPYDDYQPCYLATENKGKLFVIGENDLKLMRNLTKAGSDHAKYLRMINVTFDLVAPLYFYKEFDTYKISTVSNSCSTMHKIHAKEFTLDDFSHEHLTTEDRNSHISGIPDGIGLLESIVNHLNIYRKAYLQCKGDTALQKRIWWQMIQLLPSSYNQKRTVQLNYAVLWNMYQARKNHKLDEWREFCKWCEGLPYFKEVLLDV
jgi:hypothetical protein